MLEILKKVRKAHLRDVEYCKKGGFPLDGLCAIACASLPSKDEEKFRKYLAEQFPRRNLRKHIWSTNKTNKSRLKWLDKHIAKIEAEANV